MRASSPPDGLVRDFVAGSGTTGEAALRHGRRFVLADDSPEAFEVMRRRFAACEGVVFAEGDRRLMQDRYAGDIGDFGKYGLLRALCGEDGHGPALRLGVLWYRVLEAEENNDGRHTAYLHSGPWYELARNVTRSLFAIMHEPSCADGTAIDRCEVEKSGASLPMGTTRSTFPARLRSAR